MQNSKIYVHALIVGILTGTGQISRIKFFKNFRCQKYKTPIYIQYKILKIKNFCICIQNNFNKYETYDTIYSYLLIHNIVIAFT